MNVFSIFELMEKWGMEGWLYGYKQWFRWVTLILAYPFIIVGVIVLFAVAVPTYLIHKVAEFVFKRLPAWTKYDVLTPFKEPTNEPESK